MKTSLDNTESVNFILGYSLNNAYPYFQVPLLKTLRIIWGELYSSSTSIPHLPGFPSEKPSTMGKLIYLLILTHTFSCASGYKRPESFVEKMRRYRAKISSNSVPMLTVNTRQFGEKKYTSRQPASRPHPELKKTSSLNFSDKDGEHIHFTNKRLYFLSLLNQYLNFQQFLLKKKSPTINSCPGLHSTFLEHKKNRPPISQAIPTGIQPKGVLLSLPLSHNSRSETLKDIKADQYFLQKALSIHTEKIYSELVELCQYGSSDNYYAYENLMTHIKRHPQKFSPTPQNLQILLKTTIFANKVILSTLKEQLTPDISRGPASLQSSGNPWLKKTMKKNNLNWFERYIHSVK